MSQNLIDVISLITVFVWLYETFSIPLSYIDKLNYPGSFKESIDRLRGVRQVWYFKKRCFIWACCSAWLWVYAIPNI